jgi:diaminohydroxyphosphoribosylaminopyrimidine deaminase/5-amino-6-(5-phosphoribosylamino)uracil reductase
MPSHEVYMSRCLGLAVMATGSVSPNPMVGAVLVHEGRIIGEGYHEQYGQPHAEVNCINSVAEGEKHLIKDAIIYVSLEPCAHHGKTPPCADLIIEHGIRQVVTGSHDPNPLVAGQGIVKLRNAGIEVTARVLRQQCDFVNRRFITFHTQHRPYIILKWAQSADGYFAPDGNKQQWLTNEYSQKLVHKWRTEEDAILVGTRTALIDDPMLTARLWEGKNPVRILIDMDLKVPLTSKMYNDDALTIVYNSQKEGLEYGTLYIKIISGETVPQQIASDLYSRKMQSILIEGGAYTLMQFIAAGLWDEARILTSPATLGSGIRAPYVSGIVCEKTNILEDTVTITLNPASL